jgi:phosphatidate cytidylyltransferase
LAFGYLHLVAVGLGLGLLGQLGDLSESLIKRDCEVKDSGRVLPGMGGILDEVDSLLFTVPVFYLYLNLIR